MESATDSEPPLANSCDSAEPAAAEAQMEPKRHKRHRKGEFSSPIPHGSTAEDTGSEVLASVTVHPSDLEMGELSKPKRTGNANRGSLGESCSLAPAFSMKNLLEVTLKVSSKSLLVYALCRVALCWAGT